jgi:opine dehydrogenase
MTTPIERVAILGAGAGGVAAAAALARRGFDVSLFNRTPERIEALITAGGVEIEGDIGEGFVSLPVITSDIGEAMRDRQLVMCFAPAYGQRDLARLAAPFFRAGMVFLLLPGSLGSLEVAKILADHGVDVQEDVLLGETITLPQSARLTGPAKVRVRLDATIRIAAFPARNNERLIDAVGSVIRVRPTVNVLDTGINNVNFLIHPAPMLLNYAAVERADGMVSIMNEGMTEGVLRCLDAVDAEKMALAGALGLEPISIDDLYREAGSGPHIYREKGEPFNLRDRIWPRYILEDVPFGTVTLSSLGHELGVPMPACDAVNTLLSIAEATDFQAMGRTARTLGVDKRSTAEIQHYVYYGVFE